MSSTEMDQDIIDITRDTKSPETEKKLQVEYQECDNSGSIVIPEMDQDVTEETAPDSISSESEQKVQVEHVVISEEDQDVTEETAPDSISSESEQKVQVECVVISEKDPNVTEETDSISSESEQKVQVKYQSSDDEDDECFMISGFDDDHDKSDPKPRLVMPMPIPIFVEPEENIQGDFQFYNAEYETSDMYLSEHCLSVPMDVDEEESNAVSHGIIFVDTIDISDEDKSDPPAPSEAQSIRKRKLCLNPSNTEYEYRKSMKPGPKCKTRYTMPSILQRKLKIPSHLDVEYTRKTMKPGPKSKTRNIGTVHELIAEARSARPSLNHVLTLDSDDENTSTDEESDKSEIQKEEVPDLLVSDEYHELVKIRYNLKDTVSEIISLDTDDETDSKEVKNPNIKELKKNCSGLENIVIDIKDDDDDLENNEIDDNEVEDELLNTEDNDKIDVSDNAMNPNMEDLKNSGEGLKNNDIDDNEVEDELLNTEENDKKDVSNNVINPNIEDLKNDDNIVDEDKALNNDEMNEKKLSKVELTIIPNEELNNSSV